MNDVHGVLTVSGERAYYTSPAVDGAPAFAINILTHKQVFKGGLDENQRLGLAGLLDGMTRMVIALVCAPASLGDLDALMSSLAHELAQLTDRHPELEQVLDRTVGLRHS